ncbi:hypothetical protein G9A89_023502 [Geosiphon pyriformis]|nr:hypothetical protein G9A89_023502 [Geosiphon pyriformis]
MIRVIQFVTHKVFNLSTLSNLNLKEIRESQRPCLIYKRTLSSEVAFLGSICKLGSEKILTQPTSSNGKSTMTSSLEKPMAEVTSEFEEQIKLLHAKEKSDLETIKVEATEKLEVRPPQTEITDNPQIVSTQPGKIQEEETESNLSVKEAENRVEYRIMIKNISKFCTPKDLKRHLIANNVVFTKCKKPPSWTSAYVSFKTEDDLRAGYDLINGMTYKKTKLTAEISNITEEERIAKFEDLARKKKTSLQNDPRDLFEILADKVTSLHRLPYEEQLALKEQKIKNFLKTFRQKMRTHPKIDKNIEWIFAKTLHNLPCEFQKIIPSPITNGYRNKCEYTIGKNLEGQRTIGFLIGGFSEGITIVLEPQGLKHLDLTSFRIAQLMQDYVRESKYEVYDRKTREGYWRLLTVRTPTTGDISIIISFHPQQLSEEEINREKHGIRTYFKNIEYSAEIKVTSIYFYRSREISDSESVEGQLEHIMGDEYVHEELLGNRFRISPRAFFQPNSAGAGIIYSVCQEWAKADNKPGKSKLIDICCGTGTIGITMAKKFDQVIGIELIEEAVEDARYNAKLNGIENIEFIAGKVEEQLQVFNSLQNEETIVAILDPPRAGVDPHVIKEIRKCASLERLIYVSCNPEGAMQNFLGLCYPTSNQYQGEPFRPTKVVPIDMFPHTPHYELILEFER